MRLFVITAIVSVLMVRVAAGDEVRRTKFATTLWGSWAPAAELCTKKDKSIVTISEVQFNNSDGDCRVQWIVERATARGTTYGVRARCIEPQQTDKMNAVDLIIRVDGGDQISIGKSFDDLKSYQRCPAG